MSSVADRLKSNRQRLNIMTLMEQSGSSLFTESTWRVESMDTKAVVVEDAQKYRLSLMEEKEEGKKRERSESIEDEKVEIEYKGIKELKNREIDTRKTIITKGSRNNSKGNVENNKKAEKEGKTEHLNINVKKKEEKEINRENENNVTFVIPKEELELINEIEEMDKVEKERRRRALEVREQNEKERSDKIEKQKGKIDTWMQRRLKKFSTTKEKEELEKEREKHEEALKKKEEEELEKLKNEVKNRKYYEKAKEKPLKKFLEWITNGSRDDFGTGPKILNETLS